MPTYPIPASLRPDVFRVIIGYSHMLSRTRKNDAGTRLTHCLQLIARVEALLLRECPDLYTARRRFMVPRLLWRWLGRQGSYSTDPLLEEVCLVIIAYRYRCQLADAQASFRDQKNAGRLKKHHAQETALALVNMASRMRQNGGFFIK